MKAQDIAINGIGLIFLASLIVLAVRPQSNLIQIQQRLSPSQPQPSPSQPQIEREREYLPNEMNSETLAKD